MHSCEFYFCCLFAILKFAFADICYDEFDQCWRNLRPECSLKALNETLKSDPSKLDEIFDADRWKIPESANGRSCLPWINQDSDYEYYSDNYCRIWVILKTEVRLLGNRPYCNTNYSSSVLESCLKNCDQERKETQKSSRSSTSQTGTGSSLKAQIARKVLIATLAVLLMIMGLILWKY